MYTLSAFAPLLRVPPDTATATRPEDGAMIQTEHSGVPVAYVPFPGEQHGFRKAENIIRAHEAELYFYSRILGFDPADKIEPVEIYNVSGK